VLNPDWEEGLASSIRCGMAQIEKDAAVEAVVLLACDQPRLDHSVVQQVLGAFDGTPAGLAACAYAGTLGVPAVFGCALFAELRGLRGPGGAKPLLVRHAPRVVHVDWPDGAIDVDTPEQWRRVSGDAD
jgi:molybdenum cofactor cytidylyltransferase